MNFVNEEIGTIIAHTIFANMKHQLKLTIYEPSKDIRISLELPTSATFRYLRTKVQEEGYRMYGFVDPHHKRRMDPNYQIRWGSSSSIHCGMNGVYIVHLHIMTHSGYSFPGLMDYFKYTNTRLQYPPMYTVPQLLSVHKELKDSGLRKSTRLRECLEFIKDYAEIHDDKYDTAIKFLRDNNSVSKPNYDKCMDWFQYGMDKCKSMD